MFASVFHSKFSHYSYLFILLLFCISKPTTAAIIKHPKPQVSYHKFVKLQQKIKPHCSNKQKKHQTQDIFLLALVILPLSFVLGIGSLIVGLLLNLPVLWIVGAIVALTALIWWIILLFEDVGDIS